MPSNQKQHPCSSSSVFVVLVFVVLVFVDVDVDVDVLVVVDSLIWIVLVGMGRLNIKAFKPCLYPPQIIWCSSCIMASIDEALPVVFIESLSLLLLMLRLSVLLLWVSNFSSYYLIALLLLVSDTFAVATSFFDSLLILLSLKQFWYWYDHKREVMIRKFVLFFSLVW